MKSKSSAINRNGSIGVWLFFYLLITTGSHCAGKIGDTLDQCIKEYGEGTAPGGQSKTDLKRGTCYIFKNYGITRVCFFRGNKMISELIQKQNGSPISVSEQQVLLKTESPRGDWNLINGIQAKILIWENSEGPTATYDQKTPSLFIGGN